jgi:hypothetical protein
MGHFLRAKILRSISLLAAALPYRPVIRPLRFRSLEISRPVPRRLSRRLRFRLLPGSTRSGPIRLMAAMSSRLWRANRMKYHHHRVALRAERHAFVSLWALCACGHGLAALVASVFCNSRSRGSLEFSHEKGRLVFTQPRQECAASTEDNRDSE